jgi:hypothetical protein
MLVPTLFMSLEFCLHNNEQLATADLLAVGGQGSEHGAASDDFLLQDCLHTLDRLTCLRSSEQNFVKNIFLDGGKNIFISGKIFIQIQINSENYTLKQKIALFLQERGCT